MLVLLGVQMGQTIAYQILYTADLRIEFSFQLVPGNCSFSEQGQKIAAVKKSLVVDQRWYLFAGQTGPTHRWVKVHADAHPRKASDQLPNSFGLGKICVDADAGNELPLADRVQNPLRGAGAKAESIGIDD